MRVLIFISIALLLLNVVLFLLPTDVETSNAKYASQSELNSEEIRLIESATAEENFNVDEIPNISGSNVGLSVDAKDVCYRIGPFLRENRVEAVGQELKDLFVGYSLIQRESASVQATRVYVGTFDDASAALAARRQLTNDGVNDHFHREEEDGSYIVSLGIYSKSESAEQQQAKFREQNIAALLRQEETLLPTNYWLELSRFTSPRKIESVAQISWGESSVSLGKHPCQNVENAS